MELCYTNVLFHVTNIGLMKIVLWLLHPDPKSRATLTDLQSDSWVNQSVDISQYSFNTVLKGNILDLIIIIK